MYNGANDIAFPFIFDPRPGYPFNYIWDEANPLSISEITQYPTLALFLFQNILIRDFFISDIVNSLTNKNELKKTVKYGTEVWLNGIAETYWSNLKKTYILSKGFNSDFIAFLQPTVDFKDPLSEVETDYINRGPSEARIKVRNKIIEISQKDKSFNFVDASDWFDNRDETIFADYLHVKDIYTEEIAQKIYERIQIQ